MKQAKEPKRQKFRNATLELEALLTKEAVELYLFIYERMQRPDLPNRIYKLISKVSWALGNYAPEAGISRRELDLIWQDFIRSIQINAPGSYAIAEIERERTHLTAAGTLKKRGRKKEWARDFLITALTYDMKKKAASILIGERQELIVRFLTESNISMKHIGGNPVETVRKTWTRGKPLPIARIFKTYMMTDAEIKKKIITLIHTPPFMRAMIMLIFDRTK